MDCNKQANYALNYCRACNWNVYYRPGAMGATTKQEGNLDDCERARDIKVWIENSFDLEFSWCRACRSSNEGERLHILSNNRFTPPILGHFISYHQF